MDNLINRLRDQCHTNGRGWKLTKNRLEIPVGAGARRQQILFSKDGGEYVLTSVILGTARVTKQNKQWRDLARLAWQRNACHDVVTFAFDRHDRFVGQVRHPAAHLDDNELEFYVIALARESDRLEHLLSGVDTH
jgi:hypothetical protein